ncbi:Hsp20/alpha crystallin family protein, partial [Patescibacteria group bacterium]|nr:Hsp20/alpha crystallin family protein [Patescibacteria group bacterium]
MRTKDDTKKKEDETVEVDFGIGKISFGGLFKGIGNLIDLVSKLEEEGKETRREGGFSSPSGKTKAVWGFSIKTAVGGKTRVEPFGNVKETTKGPVVEEEREPIVDV